MPILPYKETQKTNASKTSIWHMDIVDLLVSTRVRKLSSKHLSVFCRKMAFLLDAGLTMKSAMPILAEQAPGSVYSVILNMHKRVMQGESFSRAMKSTKIFPPFMCGYVAIGEQTGQLPKVCNQLADYYEKQLKMKDELTAAMMYPVAVTLMMLGVIVFAVTMVLPGYTQIFATSNVSLPFITAALLSASNFLARNAILILVGIVAVTVAFATFLRSTRGRDIWMKAQLKIPLMQQWVNLHIAQVLSLILFAGMSVSTAIPLCSQIVGNAKVSKDLKQLSAHLDGGEAFWISLERIPYIDPLLVDLARVGEETGNLCQTMDKCYNYLDTNYSHTIRKLNKLVEPIITLVMGILLAIIMLAIVLPTFELATAI